MDLADPGQVVREVLSLEARVVAAEIVGGQILGPLELPGQEAPPQGAERNEADPQLGAGVQNRSLGVPGP